MAINYCTLTSSTVDAFCDPRRNQIFNQLVDILHPPAPSVGASGGIPHGTPKFIFQRAPEKWEPPYIPTELERIVVEATFLSLFGRDEQEVRSGMELVTVTDLQVEPTVLSVNISDLRFDHAKSEPT